MPILDLTLQHSLVKNKQSKYHPNHENSFIDFYLYFLRTASRNMYRNLKTTEAYIQFKKNLKISIRFLNNKFKCRITEDDIDNPTINNYYKFLYNQIKSANKKEREQMRIYDIGSYQVLTDQFLTKYFQITLFLEEDCPHSWFFSDTPIAILTIDTELFKHYSQSDLLLQSIKLEIDLLAATGYTLVLCVDDAGNERKFLFELMETNQFSEVHYNIETDFKSSKHKIETFLSEYEKRYYKYLDNFGGYFYFYANFLDQERNIPKIFKRNPRIKVMQFSDCFNHVFGLLSFYDTKPFPICQNCFNQKYLQIRLSNVPIYDSENAEESFIPSQTSGQCICYISPEDFLNFNKRRIHVLFRDEKDNNRQLHKYVDFYDIHKIRPDLYIQNQIVLAKMKQKTLEKVQTMESNIKNKIIERKEKDFVNDRIFSLFKSQKIRNSLEFVAYAYSYAKQKEGESFFAHTTQIYTAYQACKKFILKKNDKKQKGIVFQVETGEGKTCIVCLIASALAKMGKTVHITSSNIKLSIRDFEESFKFFRLLKIKTALLLHSNELPKYVQKKFKLNREAHVEDNKETKFEAEMKKNENENNEEEENFDDDDDNNLDDEIAIFKDNVDNYFKHNTQNIERKLKKCYSHKYYGSELFNNSSRMNFSVCGLNEEKTESKNKADVIFSTFVNFECLYLKMIELYPGSVETYFTNCGLLIDEADSILIDEIANGTIVSRSMKSNSTEVLKFVYEQKNLQKSYHDTFTMIKNYRKWSLCSNLDNIQKKLMFNEIGTSKKPSKKTWALCSEITEEHVKQMYEEIDTVHKPEYCNGKKYSIETIYVKEKKKKNALLQETLNLVKDISKDIIVNFVKEFSKDVKENDDENEEDEDDDDDDDDDEDEDEEEKNDDDDPTFFNYIVPYGYDRNGMLEPNKEFGGFIQQFIAIKESVENNVKNMIVNDISMSYLYVSHPIFVNLYGNVCGFTGTIGNKNDKKLLKDEYHLSTMKVPRHNPNLSVEFPTLICRDIEERNEKIVTEVIEFHRRGNPVLVIFQDLTEIEKVEEMLSSRGIKKINIFNGKDDFLKPDEIAGLNNSVSLGTNICGRGTDIKSKGKPLHVIVSYFSSNTRAMNQAYGRTARQGKRGTYRAICTEKQFVAPIDVLNNVNSSINEFYLKNIRQREFVEHFKSKRKWIFSNYIKGQNIDNNYLQFMRESKINVNRIIAFKYVFPICMSRKTFLTIQEQKIFSIFNCPNSQFTWRIFQRYIRELILESWSLMINELDQKYKDKPKGKEYDDELFRNRKNLYNDLSIYLPDDSDFDIVPTFMHIFRKVSERYEKSIINGFTRMANPLLEFKESHYFMIKLGFKPYALLSESGARIFHKNFKKLNYIKDPELKYERKTMKKHRFTLASITDKIDDIFNKIFMKINEILGSKTFLKLFLRRTLAGCEFGFCLNIDISNNNQQFLQNNPYCFIDVDPLLVFTIFVRSMIPVLAIILISVLVYVGSIAKKISEWFVFPKNVEKVVKTTISIVVDSFASNISAKIYEKILNFLEDNLNKNIEQLNTHDKNCAEVIKTLKGIFSSKEAKVLTKRLSDHLGKFFKIKAKFGKLISSCIDQVSLMKISVFLMLLVASFIMNYRYNKTSIESYNKESEDYLNDKSEKNLNDIIKSHEKDFVLTDIELNSQKDNDEIENKISKSNLYKMTACNVMNLLVKLNDFKFNRKSLFKKGISSFMSCIQESSNQKYLTMIYEGNRNAFMQQVLIYSTNKFPSILEIIGFNNQKKKQYIFVDYKEKGTLEDLIERINDKKEEKMDETKKLIISYGVARALEFLHKNKIVHRNLKPLSIFIDSNFYPYVGDFYMSKQTELKLPYVLKEATAEIMAPEFISNYALNQDSFKLDVFSFGIILYFLMAEKKPFNSINTNEIKKAIVDGIRPEIPPTVPNEWKLLIEKCWNQNPLKRPNFTEICHILESREFVNERIDAKSFNFYRDEFLDRQKLQARTD